MLPVGARRKKLRRPQRLLLHRKKTRQKPSPSTPRSLRRIRGVGSYKISVMVFFLMLMPSFALSGGGAIGVYMNVKPRPNGGVEVVEVADGSPAHDAGLVQGDVYRRHLKN